MKYGIWVNELGWLEDSHTKTPKTNTYTSNPSLWSSLKDAKKEAKALNTMWRGRTPVYEAKEYKKC
jgi:hypothetical protein